MQLFKVIAAIFLSLAVSGCVTGVMHQSTRIYAPNSGGLQWMRSCDSQVEKLEGMSFRFFNQPNTCVGRDGKITGTYQQRSEINTDWISPYTDDKFLFESTIQIFSDSSIEAKIFQIHDGLVPGCAPPLSIGVTPTQILLDGGYKYDLGSSVSCRGSSYHDRARFGAFPHIDLNRDGTEYQFRVEVQFLGDQQFDIEVFIDDQLVVAGRYAPDVKNEAWVPSKRYFFKHGLYSATDFEYEMFSRNVKLTRISK